MRKQLILILVLMLIFTNLPTFGIRKTVVFDELHDATSSVLYEKALELVSRFRFLLDLEVIGYSPDNKPIYAIRMTYNIYQYKDEDYAHKTHILVDAGMHSRETFNPVAVLKMIEDYVNDYYNDAYLPDYNVREILNESVLHFIPLVNPDGFDVSKRGTNAIDDAVLQSRFEALLPRLRPNRLKANLNGVDLNRNFPDEYYNVFTGAWENQWGVGDHKEPSEPSEESYRGLEPASEVEVRTLMAYMDRYDFRANLTYHSMGQVLFFRTTHLGQKYLSSNERLAKIASNITGYALMPEDDYADFGFSTHYFANNTLKPAITVETTSTFEFPTPLSYYDEYEDKKLWALPLAFLKEAKRVGYYQNKVYINGVYHRDYENLLMAMAHAEKLNGEVHVYGGTPSYRISKAVSVEIDEDFVLMRGIQSHDGRTYIEFRELFDALLYNIEWIQLTNTAVAESEEQVISVDLDSMGAMLAKNFEGIWEEKPVTFDSPPVIVNGRLMVPLSFVNQLLELNDDQMLIKPLGSWVYKDL